MKIMSPINNSGKKKLIICICVVLIMLLVFFVIMLISTSKRSLPQRVLINNEAISKESNSSNANPINFSTTPLNSSVEDSRDDLSSVEDSQPSNDVNTTTNTIVDDADNVLNTINNVVSSDNDNVGDNISSNTNTSTIDYNIIAKDKSKVLLEFKSGELSLTGATIIITDKNKSPYTWGPGYKLQIKQDGVWQDLEPLHELSFEEIAYELNENGQYEEKIDWTNDYGSLGVGSYRIVKSTNYNGSSLEFYIEFLVNNI
jgi:hypothetical protein